ncbi:MAG: hypothetical protein SGPRY_010124, partial [Prymnesium sp.]
VLGRKSEKACITPSLVNFSSSGQWLIVCSEDESDARRRAKLLLWQVKDSALAPYSAVLRREDFADDQLFAAKKKEAKAENKKQLQEWVTTCEKIGTGAKLLNKNPQNDAQLERGVPTHLVPIAKHPKKCDFALLAWSDGFEIWKASLYPA